jgi:pyruvate dehydrogenase phosphatase
MFRNLRFISHRQLATVCAGTTAITISESRCSSKYEYREGPTIPHLHAHTQQVKGLKSLTGTTLVATSSNEVRSSVSQATYPANNPTEDRHLSILGKRFGGWLSGSKWNLAAVFDGHGGWQVAQLAHERLLKEVIEQMEQRQGQGSSASHDTAEQSILMAYKNVEEEYLRRVREAYRLGFGEVGKVGACALVVLHDTSKNQLIVGNAGDCRAVLGSIDASDDDANTTEYLTSRITRDHNARMPLELLTLQKEHPGEDDVVVCKTPTACYVKGRLQLTRALGDAYLKYPEFNIPLTHRGRHIRQPYTPPYVKSTPDVHHVSLNPSTDRFVIMATDGLWDFISDEEAVKIVGKCIQQGQGDKSAEVLVSRALAIAAKECGMTVAELQALPPGVHRRSRHDDTTVSVLFL